MAAGQVFTCSKSSFYHGKFLFEKLKTMHTLFWLCTSNQHIFWKIFFAIHNENAIQLQKTIYIKLK